MGKSTIADTIHGTVELSPLEKRIVSNVIFNRLHDVYQNSTAYLTFPANQTKRFEHSIGTMKLCSDIFQTSVSNTDEETLTNFFNLYTKEIFKIINNIKNSNDYNNKLGDTKRFLNPNKLPEGREEMKSFFSCPKNVFKTNHESIYNILLSSVRIASLLHDIGHPPYSHVTEGALEIVREEYTSKNKEGQIRSFNKIISDSIKPGEKLHEKMGVVISLIILNDTIKSYDSDCFENHIGQEGEELYDNQVFEIVILETVTAILKDSKPFNDIHRIIDGSLDGDRLDYVTRDALNSGLDKGKIEYERLIMGMRIIECEIIDDEEKHFLFCPDIKALNTIEDFFLRRWTIYKNIIFHHRVIKTDQIMLNVLVELCCRYLESDEVNEETKSVVSLPMDISGLWKCLEMNAITDSKYALSQWDDSWLITVLKRYYFEELLGERSVRKNEKRSKILLCQMKELLTNSKQYYSVIKRLEDFMIIDDEAARVALEKYETEGFQEKTKMVSNMNDRYQYLKEKYAQKSGNEYKDEVDIITYYDDIMPTVCLIKKALSVAKNIRNDGYFEQLFISSARKTIDEARSVKNFAKFMSCIVEKSTEKYEDKILDAICVVKNYDIGLTKPLFLHREKNKEEPYISILKTSSINRVLNFSYDTFPQFFIYVLKNGDRAVDFVDFNEYRVEIGKCIGEEFYKVWKNKYLCYLDEFIELYKEAIKKVEKCIKEI